MTVRPRVAARRWGAVGCAVVIATASLGVMARGHGYESSRVELSGGGAWLPSVSQRLLTLIDGASEQVVGSIEAPGARPGDALSVVQSGTSAYVINGNQGTVARVDGGTYAASDPIRFGEPGAGSLGLFAGQQTVYVVDGQRRTASVTDPASLRVRDRLSLAAQPGPEQAVVDDAGRLWVIDRGQGGLTWFDGGKRVRPEVGDAGSRLVLVQGRPVLVDAARSRLGALSAAGTVDAWSCFEVKAGDRAQVLGSQSSARVFAVVSATGTLVASAIGHDDCRLSVDVGQAGDRFGPLVESGGYVFVPNQTSGRTVIVDVTAGRVVADLAVVKRGARLELLAKDGFVFYNDLDGEEAGVIKFEGGVWRKGRSLKKYDRSDQGRGILTPVGDELPKRETPTEDRDRNGGKNGDTPRDPRQDPPPGPPAPPGPPPVEPPLPPPPPVGPPPPPPPPPPGESVPLTVQVVGAGSVFAESPAPDGLPAGTQCGADATCEWRYPAGTRVVLRAPLTVGEATLDGMSGCESSSDAGGNRMCALTLGAAASVRATYVTPPPPVPVNLIVNVSGSGTVSGGGIACPPTCTVEVEAGTRITLRATPGGGFAFEGWGGACNGTGSCTLTVRGDTTASASFRERPRLTVQSPSNGSVTGGGISCPSDCTNTYDLNQRVTLTARPDSGFRLTDWGGACNGTRSTCTVTMNGDKTVSATFAAIPKRTLTVDVGPGGSVTGPGLNCPEENICTETYDDGERITIRANTDIDFLGWRGDCSGNNLSCTLTMNENKSVAADFGFIDPCPPVCRNAVAAAQAGPRQTGLTTLPRGVRRRRPEGTAYEG